MIHSQHIRLLHDVTRNYERESMNPGSDTFSLVVKLVAIGGMIYLANPMIRGQVNTLFNTGSGRSHGFSTSGQLAQRGKRVLSGSASLRSQGRRLKPLSPADADVFA